MTPDQETLTRRIETHLLTAWPSMGDMNLDGWTVRIAGGYSRRANGVVPAARGSETIHAKVTWCERYFGERGLKTTFRISDVCAEPEFDAWLEGRGYALEGASAGLTMPVASGLTPPTGVILEDQPTPQWLDALFTVDQHIMPHIEPALFIVRHMPAPAVFARIMKGKEPVAVGCAVATDDLATVFLMRTAAAHRRQGHARQILTALAAWSSAQDVRTLWLHVEHDNRPAVALYSEFGFKPLYDYHYRTQPTPRF